VTLPSVAIVTALLPPSQPTDKAIRFSTLTRLREALDCQPGGLLSWRKED
jgi:DNA-binding Xre family transcriptional regulator